MAENVEWENEAPQLAKLTKSNPFTTPSNYFEELTGRINQSVFISNLVKTNDAGFTTPKDYFNTLEAEISAQVNLEVYKVTDNQGFNVPVGYFEELSKTITTKTLTKKKTIKLWSQPLFKYAVAACLLLVASSSWFGYQQIQHNQLNKIELAKDQTLYDIDESVITEFVLENQTANTANATPVELESYILDNFSTNDLSNNL